MKGKVSNRVSLIMKDVLRRDLKIIIDTIRGERGTGMSLVWHRKEVITFIPKRPTQMVRCQVCEGCSMVPLSPSEDSTRSIILRPLKLVP